MTTTETFFTLNVARPKNGRRKLVFAVAVTLALSACGGGSGNKKTTTPADDVGSPDLVAEPSLILGGLLYDNLWETKGTTTTVTNPLWERREGDPVSGEKNSRTGEDTWRCKECHGWDYKGKDGVYGEAGNSHFTGFPGLVDADGNVNIARARAQARSYLTNGRLDTLTSGGRVHNFGSGEPALTEVEIESLLMFLFDGGLIDTAPFITATGPFTGTAKGSTGNDEDEANGAQLYESGNTAGLNCASAGCHGPTGQDLPIEDDFLGALARENGWEVLHKARFGQPGVPEMVPVLSWGSDENAADILLYTQTLP